MPDIYPHLDTIPQRYLVPPELQPQFLELPGTVIPGCVNAGYEMVDRQVERGLGDHPALIHHEAGVVYTYRDLQKLTNQFANALRGLGLRAGDRVAYRSANRPEAVVAILGTWKAGGVLVPTPPQARAKELQFYLSDTEARFFIVYNRPGYIEDAPEGMAGTAVEQVVAFPDATGTPYHAWSDLLARAGSEFDCSRTPADSLLLIWHTGGTTGTPKACYHTHKRYLLGGYSCGRATRTGPGERRLIAAPIGHAMALLYHTSFSLLHGASVVQVEHYQRPDVILDAIEKHKVHTFTAVAASWAHMLDVHLSAPGARDLSSLRRGYAIYLSAASAKVYEGWKSLGIELMNNLGTTAFANWILVPPLDEPFPPTTLGKPSPGYDVQVVELDGQNMVPCPDQQMGRLVARGPTGLTYWNRPGLQERDVVNGWNVIDDLGLRHESGNIMYLGRSDFLINTAGYKVAPVEVEEVLRSHPAVREVAVLGVEDPVRLEIVMAYVTPNPGYEGSEALKQELREHCKAAISPYKAPRRIEFIEGLPRDPVGKVQVRTLQDWARTART